MKLDVVSAADGNEAEENEDKQVAQAHIRKMCGVKEAENDTERPHEHHRQTAIAHERQAHETGKSSGDDNGPLHAADADPSLGTGPLRAKARGTVVGAFDEVDIVVHQVGINLHDEGKQHTQHGGKPAERTARGIDPCQRQAYHDGYGGAGERLRTSGKHPCMERIFLNVHLTNYEIFI